MPGDPSRVAQLPSHLIQPPPHPLSLATPLPRTSPGPAHHRPAPPPSFSPLPAAAAPSRLRHPPAPCSFSFHRTMPAVSHTQLPQAPPFQLRRTPFAPTHPAPPPPRPHPVSAAAAPPRRPRPHQQPPLRVASATLRLPAHSHSIPTPATRASLPHPATQLHAFEGLCPVPPAPQHTGELLTNQPHPPAVTHKADSGPSEDAGPCPPTNALLPPPHHHLRIHPAPHLPVRHSQATAKHVQSYWLPHRVLVRQRVNVPHPHLALSF